MNRNRMTFWPGFTPMHLISRSSFMLVLALPMIACTGRTPLMEASINGEKTTVQQLLTEGADVNAKANDGTTALMEASFKGHKDTVQELLNRGADVNAKANDGTTALMYASRNGHKDTVQELLDRGAGVNAKTNDGATALVQAWLNEHEEIAQILITKGANVSQSYKYLTTYASHNLDLYSPYREPRLNLDTLGDYNYLHRDNPNTDYSSQPDPKIQMIIEKTLQPIIGNSPRTIR